MIERISKIEFCEEKCHFSENQEVTRDVNRFKTNSWKLELKSAVELLDNRWRKTN